MTATEISTNYIDCPECNAKKQFLKTVTERGLLREGRHYSTQEQLFACAECGLLTRDIKEERKCV